MNRSKFAFAAAAIACTAVVVVAAVPALQEMGMPKPSEQHKKILMGVGEWEGTLTSFMDHTTGKMIPADQAKPTPAKETVTGVGEFWTLCQFHCDFMGMPYHGSGFVGYDASKKKYIGSWCDSMSSYFAMMEGELDPKTNALVMHWQAPGMDGKMMKHRSESIEQGDMRTMTFFAGEGAGEKSMVIEMKRKGGKAVGAGATK